MKEEHRCNFEIKEISRREKKEEISNKYITVLFTIGSGEPIHQRMKDIERH